MTKLKLDRRFTRGNSALVIIAAVMTVFFCGYKFYTFEADHIRRDTYSQLAEVAESKNERILHWRQDCLNDAKRVTESRIFRQVVEEWTRSGYSAAGHELLLQHLKTEQSAGVADTLLFSPRREILLSISHNPGPVVPAAEQDMAAVMAGRGPVLSDFYRGPRGSVYIDAMAPVRNASGTVIAVLVQRSDASGYIFPLIEKWPIPSASAETTLVRRDGDTVLFLNDVRHRAGTALSLRIPLSHTDLPAVQAVLGKKGFFPGKDYRGVNVLADLRPISGTPWFMVTKVDAAEILGEARYRAGFALLISSGLILITALLLVSAYRSRQMALYRELYQSEIKLRENREQFRAILYSIGDAVITTDHEGRVCRMNRTAEELTGWNEAEATGKPLCEVFIIVNEDTRATVENPVERVLREGQVAGLANHTSLIARDGTERPIDDSAAPIRDEKGEISGVVLVFHDVSERKKAMRALKESAEFQTTLLNAIPIPVYYMDVYGHYLGVNRSFEEFFNLKRQNLVGKSIFDIIPPVQAVFHNEKSRELLEHPGTQQYETQITNDDGIVREAVFHKATFTGAAGDVRGIIGAIFDSTDLKKTREALRESEESIRRKLNAILSPEGDIGELDLADIIEVERVQALMDDFHALTDLGVGIIDLKGRVLVGKGWQDICTRFHRVHPETLRNCIESDCMLSSGVEPGTYKQYRCKNNMWDIATPIILDGKRVGTIFLGQFLFEDEEPDFLAFCEQAGRYGFDADEYLAALARVPRLSRDRVEQTLSFYSRLAAMLSEGSYAVIKLARALAEREKTEAQLVQAQKMEAVGRLAGGVAHDFNNMLNVILGYLDLILLKTDPSHWAYGYLQEIDKAGMRSADLTKQLLAFARKQTIAPTLLDLNETVAAMLTMLERLIGEDINLLWKPAGNLQPVYMDRSQIDQILANIVVNARDAISGTGKITIETGEALFDHAYYQAHAGFFPGEYVMLSVTDDGCGIEKDNLKLIFEPFFTTKEVGKGTGLGLATVFGIVKQNNGFITVYSESGEGTTFRIYLPVHASEEIATNTTPQPFEETRGTETVLLVEDEPSLLELAGTVLEELGYTVLAAKTPGEALRLAGDYQGEIHLLLTDVVMPEMNGRALAQMIDETRPGITCLFMSGYTANAIVHHGVLEPGVHFIQKPFTLQAMSSKIREVLSVSR